MNSNSLFERAIKVIPGGVNSPVRAFRAVGSTPRFISRAKASKIYDVDGMEYIDYVCSWGPMILGHAHPEITRQVQEVLESGFSFGAPTEREVQIAELIVSMVPGIEMVRMVNSGTEAVMSAIRLARGYTEKNKIVKFDGCYHGHSDAMLVKAGSGALTAGQPDSLGVPRGAAQDTLSAVYNDVESVKKLFEENHGEIAAVIVEPVAANMGLVPPNDGFLSGLRSLCSKNGALLIFDEVITGFRLAPGGAQEYFGVQADLVTFGKIIGSGMPVGAYAGKREIMEKVAPCGGVYQAGTLSGNPIAMAAGLAQLTILREHPEIYKSIDAMTQKLACRYTELSEKYSIPLSVNKVGSLMCVFFTGGGVCSFDEAKKSDTALYADYFNGMLKEGIYLAPSQFEAMFVSAAHTEADIEKTLEAAERVIAAMAEKR
jgi:glutamate-1-semialdehyde 2,1-aminomutase